MNEINLQRTSDLAFASYLSALGIKMVSTERDKEKPTKMIWVFDIEDGSLQRLRTGFYGGTGQVVALKYSDAIKHLKSMVYS